MNTLLSTNMNVIKNKLHPYKRIAFDLDETLIGDNYKKIFFQNYILEFNSVKEFIIVTFRTEKELLNVWKEIEVETNGKINKSHFSNLFYCSRKILDKINYLIHWKAMVCYKQGFEVIVDDLQNYVLPGCKKFGVDFINSITLEKITFQNFL